EEAVEFVDENEKDSTIRKEIDAIIRNNAIDIELESANKEDIDIIIENELDA
ncbi:21349_t:CDS:1, partial [Cetraspora pellucida]